MSKDKPPLPPMEPGKLPKNPVPIIVNPHTGPR